MMDWVPIVFIAFKFLVLGVCTFFAIKWHYDKEKKGKEKNAAPGARGIVATVFVLSLLGLGLWFATFAIARMLGLDLSFP